MTVRGDPRPERERYQRASWGERLGGDVRSLSHHPGVLLTALIVLGGGILLILLRPEVVGVRDLVPGECLYIRAADADTEGNGRRIGTGAAAALSLFAEGAERAGCDLSHSHEVVSTTTFAENAIAPYPGAAALQDRMRMACEAAFTTYVGHAVEGSELDLIVGVPDATAWAAPVRTGVCLVARHDGEFLAGPAKGSGR